MELTWKDKLYYRTQEIKQRLPFHGNPKKQVIILGGVVIGMVTLAGGAFLIPSVLPKPPKIIYNTSKIPSSPIVAESGTNPFIQNTGSESASSSTMIINNSSISSSVDNQPTLTPMAANNILNGSISNNSLNNTTSKNTTSNNSGNATNNSNVNNNFNSGGSGVVGTTDLSGVKLYFVDSSGNLQQYVPPLIPPINVTWQTYVNSKDNFTIEYPVQWTMRKSVYNNHEGVTLFPPNTDLSLNIQDGLEEIGFGASQFSYGMPYINTENASYITDIMIDGYLGKLYTQASFGSNIIAAVFKYGNVYFGIEATANSNDMIYVFQYMLDSLQLYGGSY